MDEIIKYKYMISRKLLTGFFVAGGYLISLAEL